MLNCSMATQNLGDMFQTVRRAVNVLKLMFLHVFKYPPNVIFRVANINAQRANVTGSMSHM